MPPTTRAVRVEEEAVMLRLRSAALGGLVSLVMLCPAASFSQDAAPPSAVPQDATLPQPAPATPPAANQPPPGSSVTEAAPAPQAYSPAQIDQMLAPVALYPDTLLTQILMASTYPVQVVEAERWLQNRHNASLHGDALVQALQPLPWDPSVKSLVPFPQVLKMMNDQLDWTQSLGTAFANQQAAVMDRVQALRQRCDANGKLASSAQLHVVHQGPQIILEPAQPDVVYVPVYNPAVVYGPWPYVEYPPFFFAPAPGFFVGPIGIGIGFSVGFGVVDPLWGWGHLGWGEHNVFINNVAYSRISYNHIGVAGGTWHHAGPVGRIDPGMARPVSAAAAAHGFGPHGVGAAASRAGVGAGRFNHTTGRTAPGGFSHGAGHSAASHAGSAHAGPSHFSAPHSSFSRGAAPRASFSRGAAPHGSFARSGGPRGAPARGNAGHGGGGNHHH
jgi:hypothetical protein